MSDETQDPIETGLSQADAQPHSHDQSQSGSYNEASPENSGQRTNQDAIGDGQHVVSPEETVRDVEGEASSQQVENPAESGAAPQTASSSGGSQRANGDRPKKERRNDSRNAPRNNTRNNRNPRDRQPRSGAKRNRAVKRFVAVTWSSQREPVDNMYWAEAEREGEWVVFKSLEQVRTRREILERIAELSDGVVALEFNFSYPQPFLDSVKAETGISDWRSLIKRVREDLKKNADDGTRLWIDRMGRYREASLESEEDAARREDRNFRDHGPRDRNPRDRNFREQRREPLPLHERRSTAERFRRTDLTLRRAAENHLVSPIQIAYNRLTSRYEFNDPNVRGRGALLGMSMIEQLLETKPEVAVWPFMKPKAVTLVELQPWIFTKGKSHKPEEIRRIIALHEDAGWDILSNIRDAAARNADAQRAFLSVMSMIKTETREERANRPLRDYQDFFYDDPQIKLEGWFYGVGYRSADQPKEETNELKGKEDPQSEGKNTEKSKAASQNEVAGGASEGGATGPQASEKQTSDSPPVQNQIVNETSASEIDQIAPPSSAEISAAEQN